MVVRFSVTGPRASRVRRLWGGCACGEIVACLGSAEGRDVMARLRRMCCRGAEMGRGGGEIALTKLQSGLGMGIVE